MLEWLQYISVVIELIIVIVSLLIVITKKKNIGYFLALTFAVYVFYDLVKLMGGNISEDILYGLFFIATISGLYAVWIIYKKTK